MCVYCVLFLHLSVSVWVSVCVSCTCVCMCVCVFLSLSVCDVSVSLCVCLLFLYVWYICVCIVYVFVYVSIVAQPQTSGWLIGKGLNRKFEYRAWRSGDTCCGFFSIFWLRSFQARKHRITSMVICQLREPTVLSRGCAWEARVGPWFRERGSKGKSNLKISMIQSSLPTLLLLP